MVRPVAGSGRANRVREGVRSQRTAPPAARRTGAPAPRAGRAPAERPKVASRYRGEEGRRQMREEQQRIQTRREQRRLQGDQPIRFWMPFAGWRKKNSRDPASNGEREVVVLDAAPDFFRYEHAVLNPDTGFNDLFLDCINEDDTCPVCENTESRSYYALYLTVIDLEPYVNKNGEQVEWTRKLLVVKSGMQRSWARMFDREGTLRGAHVKLIRDTDKDPVGGNEIEFIDFYEEAELESFVREFTDRAGKVHVEDCSQPYDYDKLFPPMSKADLERAIGITTGPTPGSREHEATVEEEEDDAESADAPWEPAPAATSRRRSAAVADEEEVDDEDDASAESEAEEDEDAEPPARGRRTATPARTATRPATRAARPTSRKAEPEDDEDGEDEPAPEPATRRARASVAPSRARVAETRRPRR